MASTRSSARLSSQDSSPAQKDTNGAGVKRKSEADGTSPSSKRGKKGDAKKQKSIEETLKPTTTSEDGGEKQEIIEPLQADETAQEDSNGSKQGGVTDSEMLEAAAQAEDEEGAKIQAAESMDKQQGTGAQEKSAPASGDPKPEESAIEPDARNDEVPSTILEKGLIYFFFRGRVNIDKPEDVQDIARSYIVLRPLPKGASLSEGHIPDDNNCRLLALPKKVLPLSGRDKFMVFVEKAKLSFKDLKENFLTSSDYATQTAGTSHVPAVTPAGEGIYAITTTGRESHLAYMLTVPSELTEVQKDIGLREQGSFVTSAKNPTAKGPANASLPQGPDFPKEILDEFRSLRWMPLAPKHLDYANAQFLLIGESRGVEAATEQKESDAKKNGEKETVLEELEKLEGEDEIRVRHLESEDAVFEDLKLFGDDFKMQTSW